jgi:hypothetical protein
MSSALATTMRLWFGTAKFALWTSRATLRFPACLTLFADDHDTLQDSAMLLLVAV